MTQERSSTPELRFRVLGPAEVESLPEAVEVLAWFNERVRTLPEMVVEQSPLTDGSNWQATLTPSGQLEAVRGASFTLEGADVSITGGFSWHQPI